jgi:Tfp pilus assembly protein PilO
MSAFIHIIGGFWRVPWLRKGAMALAFFALALVLINTYIYQPSREMHSNLRAQTVDLQNQLADLETRTNLGAVFDELSAQSDAIQQRLSSKVDRSGIVERIARISAQSGTRIIHGSNSFGQPSQGIVPVEQDLTIEGTYFQIRQFLTRISQIETLTILRSVEFSTNPEGTLVRGKMNLVTFSGRVP